MAIDRAKIKIMQKIAVLILLFFLVILVGAELRVNRVKGESADQHIGLVAILVEKENIFERIDNLRDRLFFHRYNQL